MLKHGPHIAYYKGMKNITNINRSRSGGWMALLGATLLALSIVALYGMTPGLAVNDVNAKSQQSMNISATCRAVNSAHTQSEYTVTTRFINTDDGLPLASISAFSSSSHSMIQESVRTKLSIIDNRRYAAAIVAGPTVRHFASCAGVQADTGSLNAELISTDVSNPPFLVGEGLNLVELPEDGISETVVGDKSLGHFGTSYGRNTDNPYNIAVAQPMDIMSSPDSYSYNVAFNPVFNE